MDESETATKWKKPQSPQEMRAHLIRTKKYKIIRNDLIVTTKKCGRDGAHIDDLIEQYMSLWCMSQLLQEDIDRRGVSVGWSNSSTQYGHKKNDSIGEKLKVVNQMLMIRRELGISDQEGGTGFEDDEL